MKLSRCYWGDLRLWRQARVPEVENPRKELQIYSGIDRTEVTVIPTGGNYQTIIKVHTVYEPYANASGDFVRDSFRQHVDKMLEALVARSEKKHPLCWFEDVTSSLYNTTVNAVSGTGPYTITTTVNPHGLVVGDWVLIRRLGADLYTLEQVTTTPAANQFTIAASTHTIATSDKILRVDRFWKGMAYQSMQGMGIDKERGHWNDDAVYPFIGGVASTQRYGRLSIDLDSDA